MADLPAANNPNDHVTATPPQSQPPRFENVPSAGMTAAEALEAAQRAATKKRLSALRQSRLLRGFEWAMAPLVLALAFLLASFAVYNSDFWMHLATGRLIAHGEYSFGHDPFSFATQGRYWVNHAWLFDLLLYKTWLIHEGGGAVVVVKAVLWTLLAGIMLLACRPSPRERIQPGTKSNPVGWLAALLVAVALIAAAPRMLLQPTMVSVLFVGITFWLLNSSADKPVSWRLPAALGVLFALWVNLDAWFLLGPALVALFLLGEVLQRLRPGAAPAEAGTARLKILALTLLIGVLACFLNPHTWRAFALPPEIYAPQLAASFRADDEFRRQFASPFDYVYYKEPSFGKSLAGYMYYALLALGALAFDVNITHLRWSQVLTWLGFAILSILNWRAIPFFAVVAASIAAVNFHAWFARRPERTETEPQAEQAPLPPGGGGGVSLTPEIIVAFLGLTGRLLTLALGVAALALAWPGWLHPKVPVSQDRRVCWRVAPEPAWQQVAERLQHWREDGSLPETVHGFHAHPDLANYCAWFAPQEKCFFDYRYSLVGAESEDFIEARRALRSAATDDKTSNAEWSDVFRRRGIRYVLLSDRDSNLMHTLAYVILRNPQEWSIWYLNGRVIVAGWSDPQDPDATPALQEDFVRRAFGPQTERVPPPTDGNIKTNVESSIPPRSDWDNFLSRSPIPPLESSTADLYLLLYERAGQSATRRLQLINDCSQIAADAALHATADWHTLPQMNPMTYEARIRGRQAAPQLAWFNDDPMTSYPVLAARAARKGIASHPDDPFSYFMLARAYDGFATGSDLWQTEVMVALRQGLARITPEHLNDRRVAHTVGLAYQDLWQRYRDMGPNGEFLEPCLECLTKHLNHITKWPPLDMNEKQYEQVTKQLDQQKQQLEKEMARRQDNYELASRNRPVIERFVYAQRLGLVLTALKVLENNEDKLDPEGAIRLALTHLVLGQVEQAWSVLEKIEEIIGFDRMEPNLQSMYRQGRMRVAAGRGDFAVAAKELDQILSQMERRSIEEKLRGDVVSIAGALHLHDVVYGNPFTGMAIWTECMLRRVVLLREVEPQLVTLHTYYSLRAMVALEYGDNETARQFFARALSRNIYYPGRPYAERYLQLLQHELPKP